jgi:hypothetical protein
MLLARPGQGQLSQRNETPEQIERSAQRIWAHKVVLDVEGQTIQDLLTQLRQQIMVHIRSNEELNVEPVSAFAASCSFGDVRDALADLFQFRLTTRMSFESFLFTLSEDPRARHAALSPDPAVRKPIKRLKPAPKATPAPSVAADPDPELLQPVTIPADLRPIREHDFVLPAIQKRLAKVAGIRILSDYTGRTQKCLSHDSADAFLHSLNGLPLRTALDKVAAKFGYTWRKSGGWYLFRSRQWKVERQARVAAAEAREESDMPASRAFPR